MLLLALLAGCAGDTPLLSVPVSTVAASSSFTGEDGTSITLDHASATVSHLRLERPVTVTALDWLSPIATAHAHPGHDFDGGVAGELLGEWTVDFLAEATELGTAQVYAGPFATARLTLPAATSIRLAGTAQVDGEPVAFDFSVEVDQELTGLAFEHELDAEATAPHITLALDPAHALSFVDWSHEDTDGDGVLTTLDAELSNTTRFGFTATPTWQLSLEGSP